MTGPAGMASNIPLEHTIPLRADRWYAGYIFDLDGTTYLGEALLPTVAETIATLRGRGSRIAFLSNNPTHTRAAYVGRLNRLGLAVTKQDIIHSTLVMVRFLQRRMPGARLFVAGEEPLKRELTEAGFSVVDSADVDAVIASFDRTFVYEKLQIAFDAIRRGARFFATNGDRYCPTPSGGEPDAASIIAAIEACTSTQCEAVVGKPSQYTIEAILGELDLPASECVMTGDRLETDVQMGLNAGMAAALALTGATPESALVSSSIRPTYALRRLFDLLPMDGR
jgi:arabinose operon protein AraL